jgi:hypothetical protein
VDYEIATPKASTLVESLRGVGYSTATAIADLVDNSISGGAQNIWLRFVFEGPASTISILDDGCGMSEDALRRAMVLGASNPLGARDTADLGRFGLGLKTASFSQCRSLTVASKRDSQVAVRRWDLDYLAKSSASDWRLLTASRHGSERHLEALSALASGSIVVWEVLDRITAGYRAGDRKSEDAFYALAADVEAHLGLVFHQFLEGLGPRLKLFINGHRVKAWDPFMRFHPATEATPSEIVTTTTGKVELQGFVLPHRDKLTDDENLRGGGTEGWAASQGFYVYRAHRLMVAGGWLGLGTPRQWTMEEPYRLARLRLEFENSADADWDIDVKKSVARPPRVLRPRLSDLANIIREKAVRVVAHRGNYGARTVRTEIIPAWDNDTTRSGAGHRINRKHPVVQQALEAAGVHVVEVEAALRIIEATVPVERIWLQTAERGEVKEAPTGLEAPPEIVVIAQALVGHWTKKIGMTLVHALEQLRRTEPFLGYPDIARQLELTNPSAESDK